jgi:hypothetical protein
MTASRVELAKAYESSLYPRTGHTVADVAFGPKAARVFRSAVAPRSPHTELSGGGESVQQTRIEIFESAADKLGWETMAELFLFKSR